MRRIRFTIRGLMLALAVIAVMIGGVVEVLRQRAIEHEMDAYALPGGRLRNAPSAVLHHMVMPPPRVYPMGYPQGLTYPTPPNPPVFSPPGITAPNRR